MKKEDIFFSILVIVLGILTFVQFRTAYMLKPDDIFKKCIVDTVYASESISTIEPGLRWHFKTQCSDDVITFKKNYYKVGDTITYIYRKP